MADPVLGPKITLAKRVSSANADDTINFDLLTRNRESAIHYAFDFVRGVDYQADDNSRFDNGL